MIASLFRFHGLSRAGAVLTLLACGQALSGCADISESMSSAFADPAKYDLWECKQLEVERKSLATRSAELRGLIDKAQAGVAGPVVAELAYRNEYIAVRGQAKNAEEVWQRNKCRETMPAKPAVSAGAPVNDKAGQPPVRSGNAVY
ncbi:MAG TPA: twin-arginine translocation pathway signal [Bradyrhizobium sp.]|nr:twin-arginine translocation pathway signal [Bradyrhizobium sp.]